MQRMKSGGGWKAIWYSLRLANRVGWRRMWQAMSSRNACKTCALGMGGQLGGMVNEGGHFPEVCKKSFQAMASDMQAGILPEFFARYGFNELRALTPRELELSGRISVPLYAGPNDAGYRAISWDEAFDKIAAKLRKAGPTKSFFYASGRSSNEAGFLLQLLARLFGTNYVNNCSYYCHQASGVGLGSSVGQGTGTIRLEDLDGCDLYILIGGNPASNHPRLMRSLMQIRRRGGKVIVVNPAKELGLVRFRVPSDPWSLLFGSEIASQYVQPHIGGDIAWLMGVIKIVLERGGIDREFIDQHTEQFDSLCQQAEATDWSDIEAGSGVTRQSLEETASAFLAAKNVVIGWTMGVTHHLHGVENVKMIANLALLRGMIGRPKAGLMPIRGHSNVQGLGSVGVTPTLKQALLERFEQRLGVKAPTSPGLDTMACMDAAFRGEMQASLCLGGNLYGSNPDSRFAEEAVAKLDLMAYLSTTLNTGHAWGRAKETLILPVLPRDEEPQPTTQESMFSFVRLSAGGTSRVPGARSEVSILIEIARRVLGDSVGSSLNWSDLHSHAAVRRLIADLIPGLELIADLDQTKQEFHIPGRDLAGRKFSTPTGRAKFHAVPLPLAPDPHDRRVRLMTVRSEGQFNSVVYDEEDIYRAQERRDVLLLNSADMERLGLRTEQRVRVRSATGEMRWLLARPFDIRPGNALAYYPEANILVPRSVDPRSKTPGFKSVLVEILPEAELSKS
jgi:molybdopterin-dependent oxidoreductase alpha subunit